jgi:hypothetical protein
MEQNSNISSYQTLYFGEFCLYGNTLSLEILDEEDTSSESIVLWELSISTKIDAAARIWFIIKRQDEESRLQCNSVWSGTMYLG